MENYKITRRIECERELKMSISERANRSLTRRIVEHYQLSVSFRESFHCNFATLGVIFRHVDYHTS